MSALTAPRVVRGSPGRVRVHVPRWTHAPRALERRLGAIPGVFGAQANAATGNVLVRFDPEVLDQDGLLAALEKISASEDEAKVASGASEAESREPERLPPAVVRERAGPHGRARIAVRGIDRDPQLARRVVERLNARVDVHRAVASAITGRVLVEFSDRTMDLQDLLADLSSLELPDLPGEDRPAHPLDRAPLVQSSTRVVGSVLGLGLLAVRRALGSDGPPVGSSGPAEVAATVGILEGLPPVRFGLRRLLGRDRAQLALSGAAIASLSLSGSPLGLVLSGTTAWRLVTEVRARRAAWEDYEARLEEATTAEPGATARLSSGDRAPLRALVVSGTGTAIAGDGLPDALAPGSEIEAGARVYGGPFVVELHGAAPFAPEPRPQPPPASSLDRYLELIGPLSLGYAGLTLAFTRSASRAFAALLLVNPRPGLIGAESADTGASARVLRAGVTVVGTRPERTVRKPDLVLVDGPRMLTDGFELSRVVALGEPEAGDLGALAAAVAVAAGSPWGGALRQRGHPGEHDDGDFDGASARATIAGRRFSLGPVAELEDHPAARRSLDRGDESLVLRDAERERPIALVALRPRLAPGAAELVASCRRRGVEIAVLERAGRRASRAVAGRAEVPLIVEADFVDMIRERQAAGARVAVLSDRASAAHAFEASDLGIALTSGRSGRFPARADLLAPDLSAVAAVVEAGARREESAAASVALSVVANAAGVVLGARGAPGVRRASYTTYAAALAAIGAGWTRLRGGERSRSVTARLVDPRPERWGGQTPEQALAALQSVPDGLSGEEAERRRRAPRVAARARGALVAAGLDQLRSPLTGVLAVGAGVSLAVGAVGDIAIFGAVLAANVAVGAWQERQAGQAAQTLEQMGQATARVLREGEPLSVSAADVVPGDILLLAAGDRVVADARILEAEGLEIDEATLTGESLPVGKSADATTELARVVLEGSDVTVGAGRAVVVAVGAGTRLGATAAALAYDETRESPLGQRLGRLLVQGLPVVAVGGALVTVSGLLWGRPLGSQLALGATIAIAAVPEGLPLLAGAAQAAAARRLAGRRALVRRLAAVEALGRVDVACCDKTGTLTRGRLDVRRIAALHEEEELPGSLSPALREVLLGSARASPRPDALDAAAHPTDVAILRAAQEGGLGDELTAEREAEAPFEPSRAYHASRTAEGTSVKGAVEVLLPRCTAVAGPSGESPLDAKAREEIAAVADRLAGEGLRVLMVARGTNGTDVHDPRGLVVLGFVAISDPLRPGVAGAVRRCQEAGVRLVMLTGDHPLTARAIAREAGLPDHPRAVMTGDEVAELDGEELDRRLEDAAVIARITPLDKLRVVESLQRCHHTVAMTGDGVNDAPALRLADVGVAMGSGGTEVARQAADVILADDDFRTLVDTLIEGRGFWQNVRRALALLLGGNLGELGLMVGASVLGLPTPLSTRQILAVNLVTDVLPAVAVAVQEPEHRDLAGLAREGTSALDRPLRNEALRRGGVTAVPALAAYVLAARMGGQGQTVAFTSIVATQLTQTVELGRSEGRLAPSVAGAVIASAGLLATAVLAAPLRSFLGLAAPTPASLLLIGGAAAGAVLLSRLPARLALPAMPSLPPPAPMPAAVGGRSL